MSSQAPHSPARETTKVTILKATDTNLPFIMQSNKQSFVTDQREVSAENVQSFVIVNDIDVEEELSKAQNSRNNAFQALSMSFYGKIKNLSPERQDPKEKQKHSIISQNKSIVSQKRSPKASPDSRKDVVKAVVFKQKPEEAPKKSFPIEKNLKIIPEQSKRRAGSPKAETTKVYSPLMAEKRPTENLTSRPTTKRETAKSPENRQKSPPGKRGSNDVQSKGNKMVIMPAPKSRPAGRSCSPRNDSKKKDNVKPAKNIQGVVEHFEEKVEKLHITPSSLELKPDHVEEAHYKYQEQDSELQEYELNESKVMSQESSWKESALKSAKDTPSQSEKSLLSAPSSQTRLNGKEGYEMEDPTALDQYYNLHARPQVQNETPKGRNLEAESQQPNLESNCDDKVVHSNIVDLQDSDTEDESSRKDSMIEKSSIRSSDKSFNSRYERQRSPVATNQYGRFTGPVNKGINNKGSKQEQIKKEITPLRGNQRGMIRDTGLNGPQAKKTSPQPKRDTKEENAMKILNTSGRVTDKKEKSRKMSPTLMEVKRHFDLIDKLISQKSVKGKV